MKRGVIEADKRRKVRGMAGAKTLGRTMAAFLAAGIALIALTDKTMSKAYPQENEEDE